MAVAQVVKEKKPSVWYLFNPRFMCRVPPLATRSVEDIKRFGTPTTGNPLLDKEMELDWPMRMHNIAEMENHFNNGHSIRLVNYADSKKIYEWITDHLLTWKTFFETVENNRVPDETIDELIRLDKFATAVYAPARHLFTEETASSVFGRYRQMRRNTSLISRGMFAKVNADEKLAAEQGQEVEPGKKAKPERTSMAGVFTRQRSSALGSNWRELDIGGRQWK